MNLEELKEYLLQEDYKDTVYFESLDYASAIIGITDDARLIYSYDLMVEHLMKEEGIEEEDAHDYINYNTIGSVNVPNAPIIMFNIPY